MASGMFWALLGSVISRGSIMLAGVLVARCLGKAGYGKWGLLLSAGAIFAAFAGFGLGSAATNNIAALKVLDRKKAARILSLVLILGVGMIVLMSVAMVLCSDWMARYLYEKPELSNPLKISVAILATSIFGQMLQSILAGFQDFRGIAVSTVAQGVTFLVVGTVLTWSMGLWGTVLGMAVAWAVACVVCWLYIMRECRRYGMHVAVRGVWRERAIVWKYSMPIILTSAVSGPAGMLSLALVARLPSGLAALGGYNAASTWGGAVLFVPSAFRRVTLPMLAKLKGERDPRRFMKALWGNIAANVGVALIVAAPIMILSSWIMGFYGADFVRDWDILVLVAAMAVLQAANDVVGQVTTCMEKLWWNSAIYVLWSVILLGGSFLLVPHLGVRGYVWAMFAATCSHLTFFSIAAFVFVKQSDFSPLIPSPPSAEGIE